MQKITPFLTFKTEAEEALNFYVATFKNARPGFVRRYGKHGPMPEGTFMTGTFEVDSQTVMVLNAGSDFGFSMGVSLYVDCKTQHEIDELWEALSAGGKKNACGWLSDKYGVSWQIVPTVMSEILASGDEAKVGRAMQAMMQMTKFDIAKIEAAAAAA